MATRRFEDLRVYQIAERLSEEVWGIVRGWDSFARDTVGKQLVRSADSIAANLAEGTGRGSFRDNRRFILIARGSVCETRHWLRRAYRRQLLDPEQVERPRPLIRELAPTLNAYLNSIGKNAVRTPHDGPRPRTADQGPRTRDQ